MSNKHILPPPEEFFDDDLPEMSRDEMIKMTKNLETTPPAPITNNMVDLKLGPADMEQNPWVKNPNWWTEQYLNASPQPLVIALDCVIAVLCCVMSWLIIDVIIWMFSA